LRRLAAFAIIAAMFDLAWSHLLLIGAVALIVIGPKELPGVLRTLGQWMARARAIAREFQGSLDQMIRESELEEVRKEVEKTASLDIHKEIENTIDPGAEMQRTFSEPPISDHTVTPAVTPPPAAPVLRDADAAAPPHEPAPAGTEPPTPPSTRP
jgi:sec-independent protein translocase protein TatB